MEFSLCSCYFVSHVSEKCRLAVNVALLANRFMLTFCLAYSSAPKVSTCLSETSVDFQLTALRYIPEDKGAQLWKPQILNRKCIWKVTCFNQSKHSARNMSGVSTCVLLFVGSLGGVGLSTLTTYCFFYNIFFLYYMLYTTVIEGTNKMWREFSSRLVARNTSPCNVCRIPQINGSCTPGSCWVSRASESYAETSAYNIYFYNVSLIEELYLLV
jgi:hypothetical protein